MSSELNMPAWQKLIDENIEWLAKQPRSLEREHIDSLLRWMRTNKPTQAHVDRLQVENQRLRDLVREAWDEGVSVLSGGGWRFSDTKKKLEAL